MNWIKLTSLEQLPALTEQSHEEPVLIFKHSTRCSTSAAVLNRIERNWNETEMKNVKPYFLDLISYRQISNAIAEQFKIRHESPQVILLQNGVPGKNWSHLDISYNTILGALKKGVTT